MDQGSGRVTSPSPSPRIRRGNRNLLCANMFVCSRDKIIFALGLVQVVVTFCPSSQDIG